MTNYREILRMNNLGFNPPLGEGVQPHDSYHGMLVFKRFVLRLPSSALLQAVSGFFHPCHLPLLRRQVSAAAFKSVSAGEIPGSGSAMMRSISRMFFSAIRSNFSVPGSIP